jgi:cysteine-rich repeat protein
MMGRTLALLALLSACGDDGPPLPPMTCGNGAIAIGELCDDGNTMAGDGCDATCRTEVGFTCTGEPSICRMMEPPGVCSDGMVDRGEECDEGGETAACDTDCTFVRCGDMLVNAMAGEGCDDGNSTNGDGCAATCEEEPATCGDRTCGAGETCTNCVGDCAMDPLCFD